MLYPEQDSQSWLIESLANDLVASGKSQEDRSGSFVSSNPESCYSGITFLSSGGSLVENARRLSVSHLRNILVV